MSKYIVAITQHLNFGVLLIPYLVKEGEDHVLEVEEQATAHPPSAERTDAEKEIMLHSLSYADRSLMHVFSKETNTADFLKKVTETLFKENIRPFIEKKTEQIIRLVINNDIPLYLKDMGRKKLYPHHRVRIHKEPVNVSFHFELTPDTFRYSISCKLKGKPYNLMDHKPALTLLSYPAYIVAKDELIHCPELQAIRLTPFFNKRTVEVSRTLIDKYIDQIVLPALRYSTVEANGFDIVEKHPSSKAVLSIENAVLEEPILKLLFLYEDRTFQPEERNQKRYVKQVIKDGKYTFYLFKRDISWEKKCVTTLKSLGLRQIGNAQFTLAKERKEKDLLAWIQKNQALLSGKFELIHSETEKQFFLGEISVHQSISEQPDWFDLKITVQIGPYQYPFTQFRRHIMKGIREFTLPDGQIVLLPEEWFEKYNELVTLGVGENGNIRLQKTHFSLVEELEIDDRNGQKTTSSYREKQQYPIPSGIKATLRSYQVEGFCWMLHLRENGFGGCLADDMGLGKTLQTITLLQSLYPNRKTGSSKRPNALPKTAVQQLDLFAESAETEDPAGNREMPATDPPASLIVVPTSLLPNWTKEIKRFSALTVYEYTGTGRLRNKSIKRIFNHYNVVLTTYGLLRNDIELISDYPFECIILDESQAIKNRASVTYNSVLLLQGKQRFVLTGTPIENSLSDLWAQFNFINPGMLGSYNSFQDLFITPITKEKNERSKARLQQLINPFFLRRTKKQVAPELPTLSEEIVFCEMTPEQEKIYKKEKNTLRNTLLNVSGFEEIKKNNFVALQGITRLRLIANHPAMIDTDYTFASGKMEQILEMYEIIMEEGHKVLIFSSFVKYLLLLVDSFEQRGWKYSMLTGSTTNREEEISRFTDSDDIQAFFISLKAGGVGLNLTKADYVFIIDPWWNPAIEMQAVSRAHRIGQSQQVMVYRFISSGTIEEKIVHLQESKTQLAEDFITKNNPLRNLTDDEWNEILQQL